MEYVAKRLHDEYSERLIWMGRTPTGTTKALYASPRGSWTWLEIAPDGTACFLANGVGWRVPGRTVET